MIRNHFLWSILFIVIFGHAMNGQVFEVRKIWDKAPHNAFTDLLEYGGKFYCTFREGGGHVPWPSNTNGTIRILESDDGERWTSLALLSKAEYDLRDSKLSVMPDGRIMALMGGSKYKNYTSELLGRLTHVSFFDPRNGKITEPTPVKIDPKIVSDYDWLWRVTWHKGNGYGVLYRKKDQSLSELFLVKTTNGIDYDLITSLDLTGVPGLRALPGESTVCFTPGDSMLILVRRDGADKRGYLGCSVPPYREWTWTDTGFRLGGPHIIHYKDDKYIVGTRSFVYEGEAHTTIYVTSPKGKFKCVTELPSHGDNSYPGLLLKDNMLWVSYYSSHEGKTSIYLAKIPVSYIDNINVE